MKRSAPTDESLPEAAQQILDYLTAHPKAQDTIEGITQWWLLEQDIKRSMAHVRAALVELIARKLVVEDNGPDGRVRYRVNRPEDRQNSRPAHEP